MGGSLASSQAVLKRLCRKLGQLAAFYRLAVVPGGAQFADAVRAAYTNFSLSEQMAHRMAVMGMDQYGCLLSEITPNARLVRTLAEARSFSRRGRLPIILLSHTPYLNRLERSWRVTSDSIAARVAGLLRAKKLLLLKDVDGVFTRDPKRHRNAELKTTVSLASVSHTKSCVDPYLPVVLRNSRLESYILNGKHPERVEAILRGEDVPCTRLSGSVRL